MACETSAPMALLSIAGPILIALVVAVGTFVVLGKMRLQGKINLSKNAAVLTSVIMMCLILILGFASTSRGLFAKECEQYPASEEAKPVAMSGNSAETRRWFEWEFKISGKDYKIQLMDLADSEDKEEVEADAPEVQMVLQEKKDTNWETIKVQNTFLDLETYGEAPPTKSPELIEIGKDRFAMTFAMSDLAQGVSSEVLGLFEVSPESLGYRGHLFIASNNKENCDAKAKEGEDQCFAWTSEVSVDKSKTQEGLYHVRVTRKGNFYNADTDKIQSVGHLLYRFNGDHYSSLP
ncbi:MAG: hypothetical protein AB7O96_04075 [Pseudobdellovibrionaceae bacterium]